MENVNLTFVTPTVLANGSREHVGVVAHECSHCASVRQSDLMPAAWFGNHLSCDSWGCFALNEGFTTYLERLILGEIHGEPFRAFRYLSGRVALQESLDNMPERYRSLIIDYRFGDDPDGPSDLVAC